MEVFRFVKKKQKLRINERNSLALVTGGVGKESAGGAQACSGLQEAAIIGAKPVWIWVKGWRGI
jgi:hypothetical protein